jgi:hypothetical protein
MIERDGLYAVISVELVATLTCAPVLTDIPLSLACWFRRRGRPS